MQYKFEHEPKCNGTTKLPYIPGYVGNGRAISPINGPVGQHRQVQYARASQDMYQDSQSCLIYSQYNPNLANINVGPR